MNLQGAVFPASQEFEQAIAFVTVARARTACARARTYSVLRIVCEAEATLVDVARITSEPKVREWLEALIDVLGIEEVVTAARSPWQNAYAERLIGSLRRECLDHVIVLDEIHLLRILGTYFKYYNATRCHLSLAGDAREPRRVQGTELGEVVELPVVEGIHHR